MNYTLHQLQVFLKIAQTQSITKAAEALYLTQPAVSIQLKNFQDQFDIPLTAIIGRRLYLTDFGREIAQSAEKIVSQVDAINYKALAYKGLVYGKLSLSVVSTGKYVMPYFLSGFLAAHEGIELKMDVTNKQRVVESLEQNEVDFALVSIIPQQLVVDRIELMPNKLYLVGGPGSGQPTEEQEPLVLKTLPLIYREAGSGTRYMMERFIADHQIPVRKKLELTSNEAVKQAIIAGLGYSIMPLIGIRNEVQHGDLAIIPVRGLPLQTSWNLIWLKDRPFSPVSQAFVDYLATHKEQIIRDRFAGYDQY